MKKATKRLIVSGIILSLFIIFISMLVLVSAAENAMTQDDIKKILADESELKSLASQVNSMLNSFPGAFTLIFGTNEMYHARIGSHNLAVSLKNGKVDSISTVKPSNPTYFADTSYAALVKIANSGNPLLAVINAVWNNEILITKAPPCTIDLSCRDNEVCTKAGCKKAFTVVAVPIAYSANDYADFYGKAKPEVDILANYLPVDNELIRVHYIDPKVCPDLKCKDVCTDCQDAALSCARKAGLASFADRLVAVSKTDVMTYYGSQSLLLCGCAGGIPSFTSVSRSRLYVPEGVYCYATVVHEAGHQLGLYHVNSAGDEGGACQGPNAADCNDARKPTDLMGYAVPTDHFGPAALNYLKNLLSAYQ